MAGANDEHDHDEAGPPEGNYKQYDKGYEPDPTWAMLIGPTGTYGWAIGGFPRGEGEAGFETADVARYAYPAAENVAPAGVARSAVPVEAGKALFAIGGDAQCGAPCAARARARIGPDSGLATAIKQAHAIGVRDFLYTGPRVTSGATLVKATLEVPYAQEYSRYAELLEDSGEGTPAYAAPSPTDHVSEQGECLFKKTFSQLQFVEGEIESCAPAAAAYYAFAHKARAEW